MNKKGFTLVELLAVIAILAILVIIALPNIMGMFNQAKKNSFITEVKQIHKLSEEQWVSDSLFKTEEIIYNRCSTCTGKQIQLSGRNNIDYYVKISKAGKVVQLYVTDGTYQYTYDGEELLINEINDVKEIARLSDSEIISIDDIVANAPITMYGVYTQANELHLNQPLPQTTILHQTPNEAMADWETIIGTPGATMPFYLKHIIQNNIVTKSYLIFIVSEQLASENPGMKAGTYEFIGGYSYDDYETIYHNRDMMYDIFDYEHYPSRCYDDSSGDHCFVPGLHVDVYNLGTYASNLKTYDNAKECIIYYTGNSYCVDRSN